MKTLKKKLLDTRCPRSTDVYVYQESNVAFN